MKESDPPGWKRRRPWTATNGRQGELALLGKAAISTLHGFSLHLAAATFTCSASTPVSASWTRKRQT